MPLDSYLTLGKSGLRVSPFCLGAMTFGEESEIGANEEVSKRVLARYLEQGGNFIDTANAYARGHSEKIIGDFFAGNRSGRDRAVIATKFFFNLYPRDPNGGGAGRKSIFAQCEQSLRRLQTDYIDLYWLHNWDKFTPVEETMRALDDLVGSGKVRYIGFSDAPAWKISQAQTIARFRGWSPLIAVQLEYSLLERTIEGEHIPMAQELGMGVLPWSPLKGGALTGKYGREKVTGPRARFVGELSERHYKVIDELRNIGGEIGAAPATVALAWVQNQPGVSSTIIGARTVEQLDINLKALEVKLSAEQRKALNALSAPVLNFPADFNTRLSPSFAHAGATVNGEATQLVPMVPKTDAERY